MGPSSLILGVDPGSRVTGYAVVEQSGRQLAVVESGVLVLHREADLSRRLALLHRGLSEVIDRTHPDAVAVEDVFSHRNARSALLLGQARGVVLGVAGLAELPLFAYSPATVKRAVSGHGRADKAQIQRMVQVLLSLRRMPRQDEADAMAVAICHALSRRPGAQPAASAAATGRSR